jgi:hypothetical protein
MFDGSDKTKGIASIVVFVVVLVGLVIVEYINRYYGWEFITRYF